MKGAGIALHMIDLGGDTTTNGVSKLVFTILSAVAEAERDRTRERITEVKADQRKRGRFLGGTAPFGYRKGDTGELVPVPEQQRAIRKMQRLRAKGACCGDRGGDAGGRHHHQPCRRRQRAGSGGQGGLNLMPFDSTTFRQPSVTVLPPTPPDVTAQKFWLLSRPLLISATMALLCEGTHGADGISRFGLRNRGAERATAADWPGGPWRCPKLETAKSRRPPLRRPSRSLPARRRTRPNRRSGSAGQP